jgi:hypothetical protein
MYCCLPLNGKGSMGSVPKCHFIGIYGAAIEVADGALAILWL